MKCVVKVQHGPGQDEARWRSSSNPELAVCDRHRSQYDDLCRMVPLFIRVEGGTDA